ncbi:MAG: hypothetical protein AB7S38_10295 [Vulcanimicrobiota bacterium]
MTRKTGSVIVSALLILALLLVMGVGYLAQRASQYRGVRQAAAGASALSIAEAGLEDALGKLQKDPLFPPRLSAEEPVFEYHELFTEVDGSPLGSYTVSVDTTRNRAPYYLLELRSVGRLGPDESPLATRTVSAEIDFTPNLRPTPASPNPNYFKVIRWREEQ